MWWQVGREQVEKWRVGVKAEKRGPVSDFGLIADAVADTAPRPDIFGALREGLAPLPLAGSTCTPAPMLIARCVGPCLM